MTRKNSKLDDLIAQCEPSAPPIGDVWAGTQPIGREGGTNGKRPTRRRLAERISEERELFRMVGPRAFFKRRTWSKHTPVREPSKRVVIRRKIIDIKGSSRFLDR
jgi:hypothetical protein